ncbi:MAG: hypothetical protein SOX94_03100 [Prevotella sp.]|nr:hypothetical protein [Prevotella sp.]MDY4160496.1 hypothetical protein [Prevotella sp.]
MKKQLLTLVALLFAAVTAMAQVNLGNPKWNVKDGGKCSPSKVITFFFPNPEGVNSSTVISVGGNFYEAGQEAGEENAFSGFEVNVTIPVEFALEDFDAQPNTSYVLKITSVKIGDEELIGDTTYTLNFTTRGAERQMLWTFTIDSTSVNKIKADDGNVSDGEGKYWKVLGVDTRHYVHQKLNNEEIMLDANTPLPMTEGLNFTFGADKVYVGDVVTTKHKDRLSFNANNLYMTVPDCKAGDIITINASRATKPSATKSKFTCIVAMDGAAEAIDGITSSSGMKDSLQLGSNFANFKFTVLQDGDVTLKLSNALVKSLEITEARPIVDCTYSVKAIYKDGDNVKELKTLVPETVGKTNDVVKVNYSYWLTDGEGNLYTYGTKGNEFLEKFDLISDTTFVISYKKVADVSGVVFLSEGENFFDEENQERTIEMVTQANSAVRSSNGKAAYATADTKITTLPAGTYTFKAIIFDNTGKNSGFIQSIGISEKTDEDLLLAANADNWTEAHETFILENEGDIIWRAGGNENKGIDIMVIYKSDGGDAVASVEAAETAAPATRKVVKDGKFLIETANGTFTAAGAQVK